MDFDLDLPVTGFLLCFRPNSLWFRWFLVLIKIPFAGERLKSEVARDILGRHGLDLPRVHSGRYLLLGRMHKGLRSQTISPRPRFNTR